MSLLDDAIQKGLMNAYGTYDGKMKPLDELKFKVKEPIKALMLELIGDNEVSRYDYGEATYGDSQADSRSVYYGRNHMKEELRQRVEAL
jgi:hypothetical protein